MFIAYLQVIGIIFVVFGHSFHEYPGDGGGSELLIYRMMYSFRMPLFIFVSGFLMNFTTRMRAGVPAPSVGKFVKMKVRRLLLPYVVLTAVTLLPYNIFMGDGGDLIPEKIVYSFVHSDHLVISYFWFIHASFILLVVNYAVLYIGEKLHIREKYLYLFMAALFVFLFYSPIKFYEYKLFAVNQVINLGLYFVLGTAYCRYAEMIDRHVPWHSIIFFISTVGAWAVLFYLTENTSYTMICSIAGIMMCISLAKIMEHYKISWIDHLVGANYMIFLLSWYFNVASQQILHRFTDLPWWIYSILSLLSGIYVPWMFYRYLQRHPHSAWVNVTAFLLGQKLKKERMPRAEVSYKRTSLEDNG